MLHFVKMFDVYSFNKCFVIHSGLDSLLMYVVSGSYYVRLDNGCCVPAEISLLKFTFKTGIIKEFHAIIEREFLGFFLVYLHKKGQLRVLIVLILSVIAVAVT